MKIKNVAAILVMVGILVGCDNGQEERIKKLEERAKLSDQTVIEIGKILMQSETNRIELSQSLKNGLTNFAKIFDRYMDDVQRHEMMITNMWELMKHDELMIAKLQSAMSNKVSYAKTPGGVDYVPLVKMNPKLVKGIPYADYEDIEWEARKKYKNDYELINYAVELQVKAYKKLHGIKDE